MDTYGVFVLRGIMFISTLMQLGLTDWKHFGTLNFYKIGLATVNYCNNEDCSISFVLM